MALGKLNELEAIRIEMKSSREKRAEKFVDNLAQEFPRATAEILRGGRRIQVNSIDLSPADRTRLFHWRKFGYSVVTVDLSETNIYMFEIGRSDEDLR